MSISALDHPGRHAEIAGGLPDRYTALYQPSRRRVPKRVPRDLAPEPGRPTAMFEAGLDQLDWLALPLDEM